jgi:hypothetical protein
VHKAISSLRKPFRRRGAKPEPEKSMSLEDQFDEAMHNIYVTAVREAKYTPHEFHRMLMDRGGLATARDLINRPKPSDGYTNLYVRGFLHLTVEAVILDDLRWHPLFTPEELEICRNRLIAYQYKPAMEAQ